MGYRECRGRVYKVYAEHPADVRQLREKYRRYGRVAQAGIPFVLRFAAD